MIIWVMRVNTSSKPLAVGHEKIVTDDLGFGQLSRHGRKPLEVIFLKWILQR